MAKPLTFGVNVPLPTPTAPTVWPSTYPFAVPACGFGVPFPAAPALSPFGIPFGTGVPAVCGVPYCPV